MSEREELIELARLAQSGDPKAQEELCRRVAPRLKRVLRRGCSDNPVLAGRIDPSDLVQSVFTWFFGFRNGLPEQPHNLEAVLIRVGHLRLRHYVRMYTTDRRNRA